MPRRPAARCTWPRCPHRRPCPVHAPDAHGNPYDAAYQRERAALLADHPLCHWGCGRPATTADHDPPLATMPPGRWRGRLVPSCAPCNYGRGNRT